jgi:hypothetical protein
LLIGLARQSQRRRVLLNMFLYAAVCIVSLYILWPLLWKDPIKNFMWVFSIMARYPFEGMVLFQGEMIVGPDLPWYYVPLWFCISTPLPFLIGGLASVILLCIACFRWKKMDIQPGLVGINLFFLAFFLMPLLVIFTLHSVIYDGWRHMFFIYPPFALLSLFAVHMGLQLRYNKAVAAAILCLFLPTVYFMINNHPLQFVYFNALVNRDKPEYLRHRYELDYWGVAYKQGLEMILKYDTASHIKISSQNPPCDMNVELLPEKDRKRFSFATIEQSDYFLTNYRWHPQDYTEPALVNKEWKSVIVQNNSINMIYKLKD